MNEMQTTEIKQIELEINQHKKEMADNMLQLGKLQLGSNATIKQICNHVAPQLGLKPKDCLCLMFQLGGGINESR